MRLALVLFIVVINLYSVGQSHSDTKLLRNHVFESNYGVHKSVFFMKPKTGKANPIKWLLGAVMFSYQKIFSPALMSACIHKPSCSQFGKECFEHYGILKATFLTADRLTRCTPLGIHEYEEVVENNLEGLLLDTPKDYK